MLENRENFACKSNYSHLFNDYFSLDYELGRCNNEINQLYY